MRHKTPRLKLIPKRMPASRSGRLLVYLVKKKLLILSNLYEQTGKMNAGEVKLINNLIDRIEGRLHRESEKKYPQLRMFSTFSITFIKPKRKRKNRQVVAASTKRMACKFIRERYGKGTVIIHNNHNNESKKKKESGAQGRAKIKSVSARRG